MPGNSNIIKNLHIVPRELLSHGKEGSESLSYKAPIKNFATHPVLQDYLKKNSGFLSLQWVRISQNEQVDIHEHDVDTLMIACAGTCLLTGEVTKVFKEGDTVLIPKNVEHGLSSYGGELFWGLSLRFCATTLLLE